MNAFRRFAALALLFFAVKANASFSLYLDYDVCCNAVSYGIPVCTVKTEPSLVGFAYCQSQCDSFTSSAYSSGYAQAAALCGGAGFITSYSFHGATCVGTSEPECASAEAMLRAGPGSSLFVGNGFGSANQYCVAQGASCLSGHYDDLLQFDQDFQAHNSASLWRKEMPDGTWIIPYRDNPFAKPMEALYALFAGKKPAKGYVTQVSEYDGNVVSKAVADYDNASINPGILKTDDPAVGAYASAVLPPGNNTVPIVCNAPAPSSIAPSYGLAYNSMYGGQSESTALKVERFPDGRAVFTDSSNTRWTFRPYGDLAEKGDFYYRPPPGSSNRLVYGDIKDGRGYRVESADGDVTEFTASPSSTTWRPSRLNAADGSWLTYDYNTNGLARITDMHGRYFAFERNAQGLPVTVIDEQGKKTTFAYDAAGHATEVTNPDGFKKHFGYDPAGMMTSVKNGSLAEEHYTYDNKGRVLTSESEGGVNRLERYYEDASSKTVITDGFGSKTAYTYKTENGRKLTTAVTDALGGKATLAYDPNYNIAAATDQLGRTTKFIRNNNGDPEAITDTLGNTSTIQYQVKMNYRDASGDHTDYYSRPIKITDALGRATKLDYDSYGNLDKTVDALGNKTSMSYDKAGHMLELRDAMGSTYKYEYTMGLAKSVDPLGRVTKYKRDADLHVTLLTDPLGRSTSFTYDLSGNVTEVRNPANFVTKFAYGNGACPSCGGSQLSALTDPKGNTWTFGYDKYGRLTNTANPLGQQKNYEYDKMSRVTEVKDPAGNVTTHTYDALNRLTKRYIQAASGARSVTDYTYDAVGNPLNISNGESAVSYTYDALNRVTGTGQTFAGKTYTINYVYDAVGNRTLMSTPWGKYTYAYDILNRLGSITNPQGILITFTYDAAGRRTGKSILSSSAQPLTSTTYSYDAAGQLLSINNKAGSKTVAFANYEYDASGNRVKMEDQNGVHTYKYDAASRLIVARDLPLVPFRGEGFAYDKAGNRRHDTLAKDYKYDAANRLQENSLYSYTHDLNGNLTSRTEKTSSATIIYAYNPEQQLSEVITPENRAHYKYDPLGRRQEKTRNDGIEQYLYDNENIVAILDGNNNLIETCTHGLGIDEPLVMAMADGANYYYHADGLGSIKTLTDDKGQKIETYGYKAYGQPIINGPNNTILAKSSVRNPYMYTAREFDSESELYYYRARYYDWFSGAFTQEDPLGFESGSANAYKYVENNPVINIDPTGLYNCVYYVADHQMVCSPNSIPYRAINSTEFVSGNNGDVPGHEFPGPVKLEFQNKPPASNLPFIGPAPMGGYKIGGLIASKYPNRRSLTPDSPNGRDSLQTHLCPEGKSKTCSTGCIAGGFRIIDLFNRLLSLEEGHNRLQVIP